MGMKVSWTIYLCHPYKTVEKERSQKTDHGCLQQMVGKVIRFIDRVEAVIDFGTPQ